MNCQGDHDPKILGEGEGGGGGVISGFLLDSLTRLSYAHGQEHRVVKDCTVFIENLK